MECSLESPTTAASLVACGECDLLVSLAPVEPDEYAACPRCGARLEGVRGDHFGLALASALSALLLFGFTLAYPFLGFSAKGASRSMSLSEAGLGLLQEGEPLLGTFVIGLIVVAPLASMALIAALAYGHIRRVRIPGKSFLVRALHELDHWNMADVFFIGVLVSLTKIAAMARIEYGAAFWAYLAATFLAWLAVHSIDARALRDEVPPPIPPSEASGTAWARGLASCHVCATVVRGDAGRCPACGAPVHARNPRSIQRCLAWLMTAVVLYIPANALPMTSTTQLGNTTESTVAGSAVEMWAHGSLFIGTVIFVASIVVPILKMLAIGALCWSATHRSSGDRARLMRLYRATEAVGRWSMIDVFVVALLVALIQLNSMLAIRPGAAATAFAGVVVCTMLSARSFDPRLIWDPPPTNDGLATP